MNKIELTDDQTDEVVVFKLQQSLDLLLRLDKDEGGEYLDPDFELIEALKTALKYFMISTEVDVFLNRYAIKENMMMIKLMAV